MHNFGEEIILGSNRIPWLIWIQLIVLILLILLLSYLGLFSLDLSGAVVSSQPLSISSAVEHHEAGGSHETEPERERGIEVLAVSSGSSCKDLQRLFHPCFYLDLAKKAFFQCLGLGSTPPNPRERAHEE